MVIFFYDIFQQPVGEKTKSGKGTKGNVTRIRTLVMSLPSDMFSFLSLDDKSLSNVATKCVNYSCQKMHC